MQYYKTDNLILHAGKSKISVYKMCQDGEHSINNLSQTKPILKIIVSLI